LSQEIEIVDASPFHKLIGDFVLAVWGLTNGEKAVL
jgi:hypothetical protein